MTADVIKMQAKEIVDLKLYAARLERLIEKAVPVLHAVDIEGVPEIVTAFRAEMCGAWHFRDYLVDCPTVEKLTDRELIDSIIKRAHRILRVNDDLSLAVVDLTGQVERLKVAYDGAKGLAIDFANQVTDIERASPSHLPSSKTESTSNGRIDQ